MRPHVTEVDAPIEQGHLLRDVRVQAAMVLVGLADGNLLSRFDGRRLPVEAQLGDSRRTSFGTHV